MNVFFCPQYVLTQSSFNMAAYRTSEKLRVVQCGESSKDYTQCLNAAAGSKLHKVMAHNGFAFQSYSS
jgi:hypothetical protein